VACGQSSTFHLTFHTRGACGGGVDESGDGRVRVPQQPGAADATAALRSAPAAPPPPPPLDAARTWPGERVPGSGSDGRPDAMRPSTVVASSSVIERASSPVPASADDGSTADAALGRLHGGEGGREG
jgi:hypothetical protein